MRIRALVVSMSLGVLVTVLGVLGVLGSCGGGTRSSSGDAGSHPAGADLLPASSCVTATPCADSEQDCTMGERCNTGLSPPHCQKIYCGAIGTLCGNDDVADDNALCASENCQGGMCATALDMSPPPDLSKLPDLAGPQCVATCSTDSQCQNSCPSFGNSPISCCEQLNHTCYGVAASACP